MLTRSKLLACLLLLPRVASQHVAVEGRTETLKTVTLLEGPDMPRRNSFEPKKAQTRPPPNPQAKKARRPPHNAQEDVLVLDSNINDSVGDSSEPLLLFVDGMQNRDRTHDSPPPDKIIFQRGPRKRRPMRTQVDNIFNKRPRLCGLQSTWPCDVRSTSRSRSGKKKRGKRSGKKSGKRKRSKGKRSTSTSTTTSTSSSSDFTWRPKPAPTRAPIAAPSAPAVAPIASTPAPTTSAQPTTSTSPSVLPSAVPSLVPSVEPSAAPTAG